MPLLPFQTIQYQDQILTLRAAINSLGCARVAALDTPMFNEDMVLSDTDYLMGVVMETGCYICTITAFSNVESCFVLKEGSGGR